MKLNPLLDQEFLKELDKTPLKEVYAEIIALNDEDEVLETIEGHVTAGTVNVDGASAVRRTCTLTIVADELNIHEYYWGLHTKFKLSLGVKNEIDNRYPDIIWFKQGTFVISNFTTSQALSNYTINIQGKDKMTLLNGEMGGMITGLTHDFGKVLVTNKNGDTTEEDLLLKDIIIGAVHQFANEPLFNIIINDLDDEGLELLEYRGDQPFYLLIDELTTETFNISFDGNATYTNAANPSQKIALKDIPVYNPLFELEQTGVVINYTKVKDDNGKILSVAKMEYGKTAGYRLTPLTFAGDLILNIGDSVTSMLDKIVQMLGQYEYFYDIDGRFIFQRKKTYFNSSWNNMVNNLEEQYVEPSAYTSAVSYSFEDGQLVASYQNNPNFTNIKNDFAVWGTRKSVTGQELPVHMRYAIDIKPTLFVNNEGVHFTTLTAEEVNKTVEEWYKDRTPPFYIKKPNPRGLSEDWWDIFDWAEYYKLSTGDYPNDRMRVYLRNGGVKFTEEELCGMFPRGPETTDTFLRSPIYMFNVEPDGTLGYTNHGTGCSHYYKDYFIDGLAQRGATAYIYKPDLPVDLSGYEAPQLEIKEKLDWRELIYQMALDYQKHHLDEDYYIKLSNLNYGNYQNGKTGYEQYYVDMEGFWRQLYNPDYDGTWEPVFISKKIYEENEANYRFAKDKFKACTKDMPYRNSAGYYIWVANEDYKYSMKLVSDLTKASYEANFNAAPENFVQYYIIDPDNPYEVVSTLITEPFHATNNSGLGLGYYTEQQDGSFLSASVTETAYNNNPEKYWQVKSKELLPCAKVLPYSASKSYYDNEDKILIPQPTKEEYESNPGNYYYREYGYTQCKETDNYNSSIKYYKQTASPVVDEILYAPIKIMTEDIFNRNKTQYYIRNTSYDKLRCVTLIEENMSQPSGYFIQKVDKTTGEIVYERWYRSEEQAYKGNLYYEKIYYEQCKRYIDYSPSIKFYHKVNDAYESSGWVKEVSQNPEGLNFWFDFLDEDSELQKFGCHSIGNRPKGVNDNQVKAIYFRETPTVIFVDSDIWDEVDRSKLGYTYLQLPPNFVSLFSISAQGKSAKTVIDELIYKHACSAENITISVLPIYHLEPNTRIFVRNDESGINGEYILTRYSLNLGTGNNMSISASKAVDRLY